MQSPWYRCQIKTSNALYAIAMVPLLNKKCSTGLTGQMYFKTQYNTRLLLHESEVSGSLSPANVGLLSHGAFPEDVNHVKNFLVRAFLDLLREEKRCVYSAFSIDVPPTHVVSEGEEDRAIGAGEAVSVERVAAEMLLRNSHHV